MHLALGKPESRAEALKLLQQLLKRYPDNANALKLKALLVEEDSVRPCCVLGSFFVFPCV